ncbi:hypothetical protein A2866_00560 [Candidatus Roizmanbacteria bacterium RIFCSPHIGHO2_01_FULL_39_8]|uniref:C2 domain-containing protein n=2 Tax=Candidatus Roizmaniibacteriota TaxID=1752723 RepID=A0A1F7GIH3_9BACT|nr:MAG: hypothetical protein A2866_00560 [Candidatus Roizmanbacteria bacterium RIFCSPHIGHO2_01_FULL_39_8]OGK28177.1 MAG: hypothetical protein A3C28_02485 [Candidatus Roizmanbacteria bacterium RIFCSPHIGHO2_02_FULL_39_9]
MSISHHIPTSVKNKSGDKPLNPNKFGSQEYKHSAHGGDACPRWDETFPILIGKAWVFTPRIWTKFTFRSTL